MSKITFQFEGKIDNGAFYDKNSSKKVVMELDDDNLTLHELLSEFKSFLSSVGYHFEADEYLDVTNDKGSFTDDLWNSKGNSEDYVSFSIDENKPAKYNFSDEEINAEVIRLRDSTPGLSQEAYELTAWNNLVARREASV
jgi:c-di-GMP-related signal transduction protein